MTEIGGGSASGIPKWTILQTPYDKLETQVKAKSTASLKSKTASKRPDD
jgi:hypothetical protein